MKKKTLGIIIVSVLGAAAIFCSAMFTHQYLDAKNSKAAFDDLTNLITEIDEPQKTDEACMTGISNNLVIYGHHMNDGSMFADLCKYTDADFYKEHPTIAFDTLSGLGKYEVVAAFKFNTNRETFKYNEYTLMDEVQFAEFMENVRARQLYDTGVAAEYGDQLLTLSTCEYTYPNGRFVVVAKKV